MQIVALCRRVAMRYGYLSKFVLTHSLYLQECHVTARSSIAEHTAPVYDFWSKQTMISDIC